MMRPVRSKSPSNAEIYEWTLECPVCEADITFQFTMFSSYDDYSGVTEGDSEWVGTVRECSCNIEDELADDDALYWLYVKATEQWSEYEIAKWSERNKGLLEES